MGSPRSLTKKQILDHLAKGESLADTDMRGIDLAGVCFDGADLQRVKLAEMLNGNERYDRQRYLEMLLRVGESILRPFGYTEAKLRELLYSSQQIKLT